MIKESTESVILSTKGVRCSTLQPFIYICFSILSFSTSNFMSNCFLVFCKMFMILGLSFWKSVWFWIVFSSTCRSFSVFLSKGRASAKMKMLFTLIWILRLTSWKSLVASRLSFWLFYSLDKLRASINLDLHIKSFPWRSKILDWCIKHLVFILLYIYESL